jgi:NAD-dependent histone deacetylase SIR2
LRPDIVLYGEHQNNGEDIADMVNHDLDTKPDMLIVMGTSLSVPALKCLVKHFANEVHKHGGLSVLVNRTDVGLKGRWWDIFDYHVKDDIDRWVGAVVAYWMTAQSADWEVCQAHPNLVANYSLLHESTTSPLPPIEH